MPHPPRLLTAATVALAIIGCGGPDDGIAREPASGTVTLDGQPLEGAQITFIPQGGENVAATTIRGGRYSLDRADGPSPGPHRVGISGRELTGKQVPSPDGSGEMIDETREVAPARYDAAQTTLTADIQKGGPNRFDFELTSKAEAPKKGAPKAKR